MIGLVLPVEFADFRDFGLDFDLIEIFIKGDKTLKSSVNRVSSTKMREITIRELFMLG